MKTSKKIISFALCLTLLLSMFTCLGTVTTFAVTEAAGKRDLGDTEGIWWYSDTKTTVPYSSGHGTAADPYIVTTAAQLRLLARGGTNTAGQYYRLGNDIVLNDTSYEDWYERSGLTNWIKGKDDEYGEFLNTRNDYELSATLFRGTLDGNGYTISGLYINYEGTGKMNSRTATGWALFPSVQGVTIKNLKLKDVYIKSNVSQTCGGNPHGYAALIGYSYGNGATVSNVQIENVKFDIQSPNQAYAAQFVGVGSMIGYITGPFTATDCIVKNISGKAGNKYFNDTYKRGSAGSLIGFVDGGVSGSKHTFKNVISIDSMNPISAGVVDSKFSTAASVPFAMPIRSGSTATNVYAIGDVKIRDGSGITKAVDAATFQSTYLDTFYNGIGTSTNWSTKNSNEVPYLKLFPPVEDNKIKAATVLCDFSNYDPSTSGKALTNWSIVNTSGNKSLKGDFTSTSLSPNNFGFIIGSYNYGVHGPLVPGKIYKLEFKAKADNDATMNYALYNGSTYAASSRDYHVVSGGYDAFGRGTAELTTEWQEFSTYFTLDSYTNTIDASQGVNRPYFFIQPSSDIWENSVYFDDMVLTEYDGLNFAQSDNHYYEPTVGEIGEAITLPNTPKRDGYVFDGWYIDEDCTVALDVENTKIGDITVVYAKWVDGLTCDFSNYATTEYYSNTPNADSTWKVLTDAESDNKYLQGNFATAAAASNYAFTITPNNANGNGAYTGFYTYGESGMMQPGTVYRLTFKAKAEESVSMNYAIYNGYSYALNNRADHLVDGVYDASGTRVAALTTEWQEYTIYFTAEYYPNNNNQGTNRAIFQIQPKDNVFGNKISFDDFEMTAVNAVSFKEYDNHYMQPCVGEIGEAITLPNTPKRDGYIFKGWYTDENCTVALDVENTKIGDITVVYAKWEEGEMPVSSLDFSNYGNSILNYDSNFWSVVTEDTNKYLKGITSGNLKLSSFGFAIVDNSVPNYAWGVNGPLVPGKNYMITFKAKAKNNCAIDYAIYNGYSPALNSYEDHKYIDSDGITRVESTGNLASLTSEWTTFTTYFTMESYVYPNNEKGGVNRPVFYITNRDSDVWNNEFYFDDFEIYECDAIGFNAYGNHFTKPYVAAKDSAIVLPGDPEREDYIFTGWYTNKDCTAAFDANTTKVGTVDVLYAGWTEAVTDMNVTNVSLSDIGNGIYAANLDTKLTNANVYAINFDINTNGNTVSVGIATASESDFNVAKNIIWQRNINANGTASILVKPNVIKENSVKGNTLYIFVGNSNVTVSNVKMIDAPVVRSVEGDVNGDGTFDVVDLLKLKKNTGGDNQNWLYDLSDDGLVNDIDLTNCRGDLLGVDKIVKEKFGRQLVWNEEFNGTELSDKVSRLYNSDLNAYQSFDEQNIFIKDGKINLNMTQLNGVDYKVPYDVGTLDKMSFNRGYLEMRAKTNLSKGQWAAFWLCGEGEENDLLGEIDIFETMPAGSSLKPNVHSWLEGERQAQLGEEVGSYTYASDFNKTEYHTYGFEWTETELKFYVDDSCYATLNIRDIENSNYGSFLNPYHPFEGLFDQFYYIRISNIAYLNSEEYGNNILTYDDALPEMSVDYVRLYQNNDNGEQRKINGVLVE